MNVVDNMTRYCGYPSPQWWHSMIIKLYKQMMEHAEKPTISAPPFKCGMKEFMLTFSS
jgi:hypothetical protein